MEPTSVLQGVGWVTLGWIVAAVGATVGVAAFFRAAHFKEHHLPEDEAAVHAWVHPDGDDHHHSEAA